MEIRKNYHTFFNACMIVVFFQLLFYFQFFLESLTDYPTQDEYSSLLRALGIEVYAQTLYVRMLSVFAVFFHDLSSLHKFNVVSSQIFLCLCFFFYHKRRHIRLGTNLFFTAALGISSLNIVLSRKMHFWAAAFFFLIMTFAAHFRGIRRKIFLLTCFSILGFFRVEFFFSAIAALVLFFPHKTKKDVLILIGLIISGAGVVVWAVSHYLMGMEQLLKDALYFNLNPKASTWLDCAMSLFSIFIKNTSRYFSNGFFSFFAMLKNYFFTFVDAFILLLFMCNPWKKNLKHLYVTYKKDFFFFYLPASFAFLFVRYYYLYTIVFYVLILSFLAFLLNSRPNPKFPYIIFPLIILSLFINVPDFSRDLETNFWTKREYYGTANRNLQTLVNSLPPSAPGKPFKILSHAPLGPVVVERGHKFFLYTDLKELCGKGEAEFDVALSMDGYENGFKENCMIPAIRNYKIINISYGSKIYLSERVQPYVLPQ